MTLIKSISGIRGTIGGKPGDNLTPQDIVKFASAFGMWIKLKNKDKKKCKIVIGRDSRISGQMVYNLIAGSLSGLGIDIVNAGQSTTPTVEMAVCEENADGGIIITASHNPEQWNALKLLNEKGEFLSAADGEKILEEADKECFDYAEAFDLGNISDKDFDEYHINEIKKLELVKPEIIKKAAFKVAIDCINSVGGKIIPDFLKSIGVENIIELNCDCSGNFSHSPEPLPENLTEIAELIKKEKADIGFVVDPDVDRLAIIDENGNMFGEEYTIVAVADYILQNKKGATVSNLSSSMALREVTEGYGCKYQASAVGEVNVVAKMKEINAVIGGEGNGGVIYPELHYGRDALVGIALFLTYLAEKEMKCSELRETYPNFYISKEKIQLSQGLDVDKIIQGIKEKYIDRKTDTRDGLKILFDKEWIHLRKSNTEPIIRIYTESYDKERSVEIAAKIKKEIAEHS